MPVTILELATYRLKRAAVNGQDFLDADLDIMGGCAGCNASLAAYNGYPSKSGYWLCRQCIEALQNGWDTVQQANSDIFGE